MTPDPYQVCSKRSWDGQIRKWRRLLHKYDPQGLEYKEDPVAFEGGGWCGWEFYCMVVRVCLHVLVLFQGVIS